MTPVCTAPPRVRLLAHHVRLFLLHRAPYAFQLQRLRRPSFLLGVSVRCHVIFYELDVRYFVCVMVYFTEAKRFDDSAGPGDAVFGLLGFMDAITGCYRVIFRVVIRRGPSPLFSQTYVVREIVWHLQMGYMSRTSI